MVTSDNRNPYKTGPLWWMVEGYLDAELGRRYEPVIVWIAEWYHLGRRMYLESLHDSKACESDFTSELPTYSMLEPGVQLKDPANIWI